MLDVTTDRGRPTTTPAPLLRWERFHAGRPQARRGLNANDIGQAGFGDAVAEVGVGAVSRVGQGDLRFAPGRKCCSQLVKGDLWLGLEDDLVRHAPRSAPVS